MIECAVASCRIISMHRNDCADDECAGCVRRRAADGLVICWPHRDHIEQDARRIPEIWIELEGQLGPSATSGHVRLGSNHAETGLRLNPAALAARTAIVGVLTAWSVTIAEKRGHVPPQPTVPDLAEYVATNATWLAAYPAAGDCVDELRELAHGDPWRVAYRRPGDISVTELARCPMWSCSGVLHAIIRRTGTRPSEIVCNVETEHRWLAHEWLDLSSRLGDR